MSGSASVLVVDVGTSGVRSAVVRPDGAVQHVHRRRILPISPDPGTVELDAAAIAEAVLATATEALAEGGPVGGVGIANQRASTIVWERATGRPLARALGWQDLRTVTTCLELQASGIFLAPNMSATKVAWILDQVDPERRRGGELCFGTVDSWVAWVLSGGAEGGRLHVTDASNAGVTGLVTPDASAWDDRVTSVLRIPGEMLPAIVDSTGVVGTAHALPGAPPICALVGDQQASLVGQGATRPGLAKATFGTGGMLDQCTGRRRDDPGDGAARGGAGTFPIVAWRRHGELCWGVEAIMLSAGTCLEWLRDDLGILGDVAESASLAAQSTDAGDVWFVPALFGLGTPVWDFGARGTLVGITRGTSRPLLVRAVLKGVAHRGADLLEAAESDSGLAIPSLRVDGGMSENDVFVQELADATGRVVELSPETEATTRGAGYLAGLALGTWGELDELADLWAPRRTVEPRRSESERDRERGRWLEARQRAERTIPELSGITF